MGILLKIINPYSLISDTKIGILIGFCFSFSINIRRIFEKVISMILFSKDVFTLIQKNK